MKLFKIEANKKNVECMVHYANILLSIGQETIDRASLEHDISEAEIIVQQMSGKRNYIFVEAQYTLDTVKNKDVAYFVGSRYIEKAADKGNQEAIKSLEKIQANQKVDEHKEDYYKDLYKTLTQTVLNA